MAPDLKIDGELQADAALFRTSVQAKPRDQKLQVRQTYWLFLVWK